VECFVDLVQRPPRGGQLVGDQLTGHDHAHVGRDVVEGADLAHYRPRQASAVAEQRRGDTDLTVRRHHADDDSLSARGKRCERGRGHGRVADGFNGDGDPLAATRLQDGVEEIGTGRVDRVGRAEGGGCVPAVRLGVNRDDAAGACDPRGLDRA
jgi:hypothetical protein